MFRELLPYVDESWLDRPGDYTARQRRGQDCSLTMVFLTGSEQAEIRYFFGSESEGLPRDIRDFVYAAIDVTQAWYEEQQQVAGKAKTEPAAKKQRWKFW